MDIEVFKWFVFELLSFFSFIIENDKTMNAFIENCQFYQYPYSQWHRSVSTFMNFGQVSFLCYIVLHSIYVYPCFTPLCSPELCPVHR